MVLLSTQKKASEKRAHLRDQLKEGRKPLRFPGSISPLVSMLIEQKGFEGVYISGAVLSNDLGLPDIGLTTLTEVCSRGRVIAQATNLPSIIDVDTGFGGPMNAARTLREVEDAGHAGLHIEDQTLPKRCGHLAHKQLAKREDMAKKIQAMAQAKRDSHFLIVARTDARAGEGLAAAIDRAKAYVDAGAEMIFPEALKDEGEFEAFRKEIPISVPLLANMTEFGQSKLLSIDTLAKLGIDIVIYPVTALRLAMKAIEEGLDHILENGHQEGILTKMQHRKRLYEILKYRDYNQFDEDIFNFKLKP